MAAHDTWRLSGTYLEACNCDAICPCRTIDGMRGGRSTYGFCAGALSWRIEQGSAGTTDLAGLDVGLVFRYDDDEPRSPWTFVLYLDERADQQQLAALEEIFLGHRGGTAVRQFPWALKPSTLVAVRPARIELDHAVRKGWFRLQDYATVRIAGPVDDAATVTCLIPGHHQAGSEVIVDELRAADGPLDFEFSGRCGYSCRFEYAGPD
jgi:hypothetical protein